MEIDIWKETVNVLKKDPGINTETLKNREKAAIVDALKGKYPLPLLLERLKLPKNSYYYQETALKKQDNSACEGLFGRLKNEMFYKRDWTGVSIQEFIDIRNEYLEWHNEKRIKISLGNRSPLEYRRSLGLAA